MKSNCHNVLEFSYKKNIQTTKGIPNKEIRLGQTREISYKKVIHAKGNISILYKEIIQDKTREFSDKKNIHATGYDDYLQ